MFSRTQRGLSVAITALGLTAALAGCATGNPLDTGGPTNDAKALTIGSQGFPESEILAQVYGQVLENAGYKVDYNLNIGSREVFLKALADGSIDLIPDYAGNLLYGSDPSASATTIDDISAALPDVLEPNGLTVLDPAEAEDADALVVTSKFAKENEVKTIGDLAPIASTLTLGANTEFQERWFGRLDETYGVSGLTFKAIDDYGGAGTLKDLLDNVIQVADIYTTTPSIKANDLVVLEDPEHMIAAQNVIPLLDEDAYSADLATLLNAVSAKLTTSDLSDLNEKYAGDDKPSAADVAAEWLKDNGFLK